MKTSIFILVVVLLSFPLIVFAAPIDLHVVSNSNWKSSNILQTGWNNISFNDSAWVNARSNYPTTVPPDNRIPGTSAEFIWYDPNNLSDGTTGPIEVWLRYSFDLNIQLDSLPLLGQALVSVDDDYEFFVNGTRVILNDDETAGGPGTPTLSTYQFVDFTNELVNGTNVFAIHAADGYLYSPYDRSYENVLVDGRIITTSAAVPEPSSLFLVSAGLLGFLLFIKRKGVTH